MSLMSSTPLTTREELDALTHAATQSMTQLGNLKTQVDITRDGFGELTTAVNNLGENGMGALSGTLSSVQGLFQSLGVELGATPQRILSVATATTNLASSIQKLGKIKQVKNMMDGLSAAWALGIKNAGGLIPLTNASALAFNLKAIAAGVKAVALKALPFVAVAAAIAALVTGVIALVRWFNRSSEAAEELREQNYETAKAIEEVSDRLANNRQAHEDNLRSIERSTQVNGQLIDRLKDLNDAESLNDTERAQKIATIRELNDSIEGLNLVYCEETGLLDENSQLQFQQLNLRNDIADATLVAEANQQRLNEALYEEQELLMKIEDLDFEQQRRDLTAALEDGSIRQGEYNELVAEMEDNYESLRYELYQVQGEIGYLENAWYESLTAMTYLTSQYVTDQRLTWDSLNDHQQCVMNNLKSMITDYTDHAQNRMSTLSDEVTVTGRDMIDNMLENQRVLATWADNIALLAERGIDEGLLEEMRQMGPEGAAQVAAMVAMCDDEFAEMNTVYAQGAYVATNALATQLGEGFEKAVDMASHFVHDARTTMVDEIESADFESIGQSIPDGAARGVARSTEYITAMRELAEDGKDEYTSAIGYNSPSRVYMGYGESIVKGLCKGIERLKPQGVRVIEHLARDMKRVYNTANRTYQNIGQDLMNGLNQGLLSREAHLMATARRIANNMQTTMQRALQINSPSRVMREKIGRFIPEGVAAGIEKYANVAIDSVDKLANDMISINIPSIESMIGIGPSMRLAGAGGNTTHVSNDNKVNYAGLFDGATINWHGEEDIRRTMEKIAWQTEREKARMW